MSFFGGELSAQLGHLDHQPPHPTSGKTRNRQFRGQLRREYWHLRHSAF